MAKEYLYSYYAEAARAVSRLIESEYDVEEIQEVYVEVRNGGKALDYWKQAIDENVNLHPVEFMSMADLKEVVAANEGLRNQLNFPSKTKCREAFDLVETYRNKIMHGYRTVVLDQEDVNELAASLETASEMTIHVGSDGPGMDIPP
jgi:DNA-binding helix-hairpin-helix protein with protein kinase domain